jgi:hypothetical protein
MCWKPREWHFLLGAVVRSVHSRLFSAGCTQSNVRLLQLQADEVFRKTRTCVLEVDGVPCRPFTPRVIGSSWRRNAHRILLLCYPLPFHPPEYKNRGVRIFDSDHENRQAVKTANDFTKRDEFLNWYCTKTWYPLRKKRSGFLMTSVKFWCVNCVSFVPSRRGYWFHLRRDSNIVRLLFTKQRSIFGE